MSGMAEIPKPDPRCVRCGHPRSVHVIPGPAVCDTEIGLQLYCLPLYPIPGVMCGCGGFHDGSTTGDEEGRRARETP